MPKSHVTKSPKSILRLVGWWWGLEPFGPEATIGSNESFAPPALISSIVIFLAKSISVMFGLIHSGSLLPTFAVMSTTACISLSSSGALTARNAWELTALGFSGASRASSGS